MSKKQRLTSEQRPKLPTRRDVLRYGATFAVTASVADILAACESSPTSGTSSRSKTLTVAQPLVAQNLDRELNTADQIMQETEMQVAEPLVEWKRKLRSDGNYDFDFSDVEPVLAESWQKSNGGRTFTWNLRKGVKSPMGNELTAEVLKWNYDRAFALKGVGLFFMQVLQVQSPDDVKVVGDYSLQVTASKPSSLWLNMQPQHLLAPLDAQEYKKHATSGDPWALEFGKQNIVAFGPYQIERRTVGQQLVFTQNPNYWRQRPQFEQIIFKEVPEAAVRFSLLQNGDVDVAKNLSYLQMSQLKTKSGVRVNSFLSSNQGAFTMNNLHPPLNNVKVRQAISYALPYEEILTNVFYGLAYPIYGPLNQIFPTVDKTLWPYKTNVDMAKSLLNQGGYAGQEIKISYPIGDPQDEPVALLVQSALKQIGMNATVNKLTPAAISEQIYASPPTHDIALFHGGANDPDPFYALFLYYYSKSQQNLSQWSNPEADQAILTGLASQDQAERTELSTKVQKLIIEGCPDLYYCEPGVQIPARSNISGMFPRMTREIVYADLKKT